MLAGFSGFEREGYFAAMDWDTKPRFPSKELLANLGLTELTKDLW